MRCQAGLAERLGARLDAWLDGHRRARRRACPHTFGRRPHPDPAVTWLEVCRRCGQPFSRQVVP